DPAALPNVGRMASADDRAIAEPAKPDSHVMAVLASADDDGTRGDPADIGTMDTHAAGLAHRFTGAAGAAIPAVPAIPVPGPMIGVAAFDDDACAGACRADAEIEAVSLGCCGQGGECAQPDDGGDGGGPDLAQHCCSPSGAGTF